jgi:hypothetical protein
MESNAKESESRERVEENQSVTANEGEKLASQAANIT